MGLLLILALASLAFANERRITRRAPTKEPALLKGNIYFNPLADWNKDLEIEVPYVEPPTTPPTSEPALEFKKVDDFDTIIDGAVADEKVLALDKTATEFAALAASKETTTSCGIAINAILSYQYGLFGYTALIKNKKNDIAPSITKLVADYPAKSYYTGVPEDKKTDAIYANKTIPKECGTAEFDYFDSVLSKNGFADAACYPNTAIPAKDASCVAGKKDAYLKGYRIGYFDNADVETIKKLVLRFGAVSTDEGIIIGWDIAVPTPVDEDETTVASNADEVPVWVAIAPYGTDIDVVPYKGHNEIIYVAIENSAIEDGEVLISGFSVIRTFLSLILAAVVIPAFFL